MSLKTAFAPLPALDLLAACVSFLQAREQRIEREREQLAQELLSSRRFFGLLKSRARTYDQAIAILKDDNGFGVSVWNRIAWRGEHWADRVMEVQKLCEMANGDPVYLSAEMADLLRPHYQIPKFQREGTI